MNLSQIFRKQGGFKLLKQYFKGGALFSTAGVFLLLGKSRTALEILRLTSYLKIKQKLARKYAYCLDEFDKSYDTSAEHKSSDKIWICWFQGMDNAPDLVKKCYDSVVKNLPDKKVILITTDNMSDYVEFPPHIMEKWKKGIITHTHMTDLLRAELLIRHGGTWIDSTVFCSGGDIPDYFFNSELFFYQTLKPGRDGHASYISSWYLSARTNNRILSATRDLCYEYWKKNNDMYDYFLFHDFFSIVLDKYEDEWNMVIPRDNSTPHFLLHRLFNKYDQEMWDSIRSQTPFHKLTYKFEEDKPKIKSTFYDVLFGDKD